MAVGIVMERCGLGAKAAYESLHANARQEQRKLNEYCQEHVAAEERLKRLAREARQRDALVREVRHRIKNHLQGVCGMLQGMVGEHPEGAHLLEKAIARVRAIAQVYGLQSGRRDARVRLSDLLQTTADYMVGPVSVICTLPPAGKEVMLAAEEAVPMALVINELITNAIKHLTSPDIDRPIQVSMEIENGKSRIVITNAPAALPAGFDPASGKGTGTGLELLKALLPRSGATLSYRQEGDAVITELVLEPPVLIYASIC